VYSDLELWKFLALVTKNFYIGQQKDWIIHILDAILDATSFLEIELIAKYILNRIGASRRYEKLSSIIDLRHWANSLIKNGLHRTQYIEETEGNRPNICTQQFLRFTNKGHYPSPPRVVAHFNCGRIDFYNLPLPNHL